MIDQIKNAVKKIEELPKDKQLEIAQMIQDEIKWHNSFENSYRSLDKLAEEAISEYKLGKTSEKSW